MSGWQASKVSIWPVMDHEPDLPKEGLFAITLSKGSLELALSVSQVDGRWIIYLDGYPLARPSTNWRMAFGRLYTKASFLSARPITQGQYDMLIYSRLKDALAGVDTKQPFDLNRAQVPF